MKGKESCIRDALWNLVWPAYRATPSESHAKIRPTANSSSKDQGNEQTPLAPPEAVKRISRIPPNAVPFLSADMLQDRVVRSGDWLQDYSLFVITVSGEAATDAPCSTEYTRRCTKAAA